MARRKITAGDWFKGAAQSIRSGNAMNPLATQKFINHAHDSRVARLGTMATDGALGAAYREAKAQRGRDTQFESNGVKVLVKNGFSRRFNQYTTDIILIDPGRRGQHLHYVLDEAGNEIHKEWTADH